jgi:hypothetical protein
MTIPVPFNNAYSLMAVTYLQRSEIFSSSTIKHKEYLVWIIWHITSALLIYSFLIISIHSDVLPVTAIMFHTGKTMVTSKHFYSILKLSIPCIFIPDTQFITPYQGTHNYQLHSSIWFLRNGNVFSLKRYHVPKHVGEAHLMLVLIENVHLIVIISGLWFGLVWFICSSIHSHM